MLQKQKTRTKKKYKVTDTFPPKNMQVYYKIRSTVITSFKSFLTFQTNHFKCMLPHLCARHKPFVVSLLTQQYTPNIPDSYTWELQSLEMHSNITGTYTHIHRHPCTHTHTHTWMFVFLKHKTSLITHTDYDSWFSMALANHSGEVCEIFSMMLLTWKHRLWIWRSHIGNVSRAAKDKTNSSSRTVKVGQWTATYLMRKEVHSF